MKVFRKKLFLIIKENNINSYNNYRLLRLKLIIYTNYYIINTN